jgi:hypothetical protein
MHDARALAGRILGLRPSRPRGGAALGAMAMGAVALAATAVGALAVGSLAIGALVLGRGRVRRLEVDDLEIRRLRVRDLVIDAEEPAHVVLRTAELAPPAPRLPSPGRKRTRPARNKSTS